ncbi:MAG TPA: DUF1385 domain-containing protein [Thermoanaerobaculia bacterium]|jgi:uncharacterized protein YqhQ|nr:DUF1385 domain-containing protein [Thermoanaerobaculia bacterium]
MQSNASPEDELLVGGQALIEGVMMRSPGAYGVAVRRPDGSLAFQRGKVNSLARRFPILKLPILRGVAVLFQSLGLGIRSLNFSAEQAVAAAEAENPAAEPAAATPEETTQETSNWAIAGSMAFGLGLGVVVFLLAPLWLTHLGERYVFGGHLTNLQFNLLDGGLRAVFFLAYIWGISRMKDIHRVFQYHGAEHKVVFNYEKRLPLTVENARVQSRLHPRCGTSFLLFVLLVSILVFALIPKTAPFLVKFGGRLLLVPAIAGLSYEVLRFTAKHRAAPLFAVLVAPGLALQRITTQEPTDDMLEVAIAALEEALREDGLLAPSQTPIPVPAIVPSEMPGAAARASL